MALLADTAKLVGNSVYGKTITNKEKHKVMKYITEERKVSSCIRSNRFSSLVDLGGVGATQYSLDEGNDDGDGKTERLYEIEMLKKRVSTYHKSNLHV